MKGMSAHINVYLKNFLSDFGQNMIWFWFILMFVMTRLLIGQKEQYHMSCFALFTSLVISN